MTAIEDRIINASEIQKSPRGRPKELDDRLCNKLTQITPGSAILLGQTFGEVPMKDRNKVSTIIRKHWKLVREDKPSINYTPTGVPQVSIRKS
jgi:hypothetical protein